MKTQHNTIFSDSSRMSTLDGQSVDLVVTSPPYPMIEMWDKMFIGQSSRVKQKMKNGDGPGAFEAMHQVLDRVWKEVYRVLKPGGFACINIGDATRTIREHFGLYTNHARILSSLQELGFTALPCILWRKQTNAPNKFMGSGMLPAGAYVTLEHEYILVVRKGGKREFSKPADKVNRRASALFWEERNLWFSDIWLDLKGSRQALNDKAARKRSGAYPFELAYRLINMYSVKRDLVLDPFMGTGTTALAAMAAGRSSVGYEIDNTLQADAGPERDAVIEGFKSLILERLSRHVAFVRKRIEEKGNLKHINIPYGFPVMTAQEKELLINEPIRITREEGNSSVVSYVLTAQEVFCREWGEIFKDPETELPEAVTAPGSAFVQQTLF